MEDINEMMKDLVPTMKLLFNSMEEVTPDLARFIKRYHDELIKVGFSKEQAAKICSQGANNLGK